MAHKKSFNQYILQGDIPEFEPSDKSLGYELFRSLLLNRKKIAQYNVLTKDEYTFNDVRLRSVRVALALLQKGVTQDDLVCLCTSIHIDGIIPLYATLFIGAKFSATDASQSEEELTHLLKNIKPKVIFVIDSAEELVEKCLNNAECICEIISMGISSKHTTLSHLIIPTEEEKTFNPHPVKSNKDTAIIFFSSGTTGFPKGICCSHYSLMGGILNVYHMANCGRSINLSNYFNKNSDERNYRFLYTSPLYWISGILLSIGQAFTASSSILTHFDPEKIWTIIHNYKPNILFLQPSQAAEMILKGKPLGINISSLETVWTGGSNVTNKLLGDLKREFPSTNVIQAYGLSETCVFNTTFNINSPEDLKLQIKHLDSCGRPMPGISIKVVDVESNENLGPNQVGEIRIKSNYLMNGYYKKDSSSSFDEDGFFKTGDIGYYDEDKCFYITDRIKDIITYNIYRVKPSVIEHILVQHPAIQEGFVFGIPHEVDTEHAMAAVVLKSGSELVNSAEICKFVNDKVTDTYKLRGGVKIVKDMLRTPTGKIKKLAMKRGILEGKY